jgi:hypothetical protein
LFTQRPSAFDRVRLMPFPFPDFGRNTKQFVDTLCADNQTAVVVSEGNIAGFNQEVTEAC